MRSLLHFTNNVCLAVLLAVIGVSVGCGGSDPEETDPCLGINCSNAGQCVVVDGQAMCDCYSGYQTSYNQLDCNPICGDGRQVVGEGCDDGANEDFDGCSSVCTVETGYACSGSPSVCVIDCGDGLILADEQCDDGNGTGGDGCSSACEIEPGWSCTGEPSECLQTVVVHVASNSTATNPTGESWAEAFSGLQEGLDSAQQHLAGNPQAEVQVWVRMGTYSPYQGSISDSYFLHDGLSLYGGFDGAETELDQRDPWSNVTTLTGQGGAWNVIEVDDVAFAAIDGFRITGGNAGGLGNGGALWVSVSDLEVRNCIIEGNIGNKGGGLYLYSSQVTATNCIFRNNDGDLGGAVMAEYGYFRGRNSLFVGNSASSGGVAYGFDSGVAFENCTLYGNTASGSDAVHATQADFTNTIVWGHTGNFISAQVDAKYSVIQGGETGTQVLDSDPLFVNAAAGDFRLSAGSPCIDSGTSSMVPDTDMYGAERRDDPNTPNTGNGDVAYYDMGAFEF